MSASSTSWPPRLIVAAKVSLFSRPAVTIDDEGIDGQPGHALGSIDGKPDRLLGLSRSTIDAGLHAARFLVADADHLRLVRAAAQQLAFARAGFSLAIMQQTLLEPTSSTVTMPERRARRPSACRASSYPSSPASTWLRPCMRSLERGLAARRRLRRQLHDEAVGKPHVDGSDVARQQPGLAVQRRTARRCA